MINLYGLRYFYDAGRVGSMTEASRLNQVGRSAISQAIKKLEADLGAELLRHRRRGLELTPAGRLLLERAEQIFAEVDRTASLLRRGEGLLRGTLTIGSAQALASHFLQDILKRLMAAHPTLEVKVRVYTSQALVKKLANRELDLALLIGDESLAGAEQIILHRGHFKLLLPKSLKPRNARYALTESRPETNRARALYERQFSATMPVYAEIASWDAIWTWVHEGLCGGLVPDFLLKRNPAATKRTKVVLDKVWPYEAKVVVPKSRLEDPLVAAFIDVLQSRSRMRS